jgi:hypothetical protein
VPIRCGNLNLEDIFEGLPVLISKFPMRYPGLPLSIWQLKRVEFQHVEDKMAGTIPTWDGIINIIGRTVLAIFVIASQAIFHLTPLMIPSSVSSNMKKIEISFVC